MNKKLCAWMLGLLASGLLLMGIGVGLGFAEFADFGYAGATYVGTEHVEKPVVLELPEEGRLDISFHVYGGTEVEPTFVEDESQEPGKVHITVKTIGVDMDVWIGNIYEPDDGTGKYMTMGCSTRSSMEALMLVKDHVLRDIRDHQIGSYYTEKLEAVTVRLNPADVGRVELDIIG